MILSAFDQTLLLVLVLLVLPFGILAYLDTRARSIEERNRPAHPAKQFPQKL